MSIDYYQLERTSICPFCGRKNRPDWHGSVVSYVCSLCGFSTKFIDSDGFKEWEVEKKDGEDFEDAVMRTEKEALDEINIKHKEPTQTTVEAIKMFQNLASKTKYVFYIYDDIDEIQDEDRKDKSHLSRFLVREIFKED